MYLLPKNPRNDKVLVEADHLDTPRASNEVVIDWLRATQCDKPWCGKSNPSVQDPEQKDLKGYGRIDCTLEELLQSKCD